MCITLFIILTIAFMVVRLMPGSVYDNPEYSIEIIQALEAKAQLDKPWIIQYFHFLKGALRGDWGVSVKIAPGIPVFSWSSLEKTSTHIRSGSRTLRGPICLPGYPALKNSA